MMAVAGSGAPRARFGRRMPILIVVLTVLFSGSACTKPARQLGVTDRPTRATAARPTDAARKNDQAPIPAQSGGFGAKSRETPTRATPSTDSSVQYEEKRAPFGDFPHDEVSLSKALEIWKNRPFLVGGDATSGARLRVLLTKARPPKDSSVYVVYERGSTAIEKSSSNEIYAAGGVVITMSLIPAGTGLRQAASDDPHYKQVRARGHDAQIKISMPNPPKGHPSYVIDSNNDMTTLFWTSRVGSDWLTYVFQCKCSEDEVVALADGARDAS